MGQRGAASERGSPRTPLPRAAEPAQVCIHPWSASGPQVLSRQSNMSSVNRPGINSCNHILCAEQHWSMCMPPSVKRVSPTQGPVQFTSVTHSCPTFCDPMDCTTPGFPIHYSRYNGHLSYPFQSILVH